MVVFLMMLITFLHGFTPSFKTASSNLHGLMDPRQRRPMSHANFISLFPAKVNEVEEVPLDYSEDLTKTGLWLTGSALFCGLLSQIKGVDSAIEFASGYFLEQALSVDNLFVFILLFGYFKIPKQYEEKILGYGILGGIFLPLSNVLFVHNKKLFTLM